MNIAATIRLVILWHCAHEPPYSVLNPPLHICADLHSVRANRVRFYTAATGC